MTREEFIKEMIYLLVLSEDHSDENIAKYAKDINRTIEKEIEDEYK